jgi:SMC interacting uncharacterized protein involved in chromosome segregation
MMTPQGNGMEDIRKIAEQNRVDIEVLKTQHQGLAKSLEEKHIQNRKDMHSWRGDLQKSLDMYYLEIKEIGKTMHTMQLTSARSKGFWLGVGAVFSFVLQMIGFWIEHAVKHGP